MTIDTAQLLATLAGAPFSVAFISMVRKFWPSVDGKVIPLLVVLLSVLATIIGAYAHQIPAWGWTIIAVFVSVVTSLGGVETLYRVAAKVGTAVSPAPAQDSKAS